ncbi:diguanylate cyclase [Eggerthellaceae bacterium zg-893]|nr:diguanylate cyclase [Eggerthellaceae bacterium zg-893]
MAKWSTIKKVFSEDQRTDADKELQLRMLFLGSSFLAAIAAIFTAMNIAKGWWLMAASTTLLVASLLVAAILAKRKNALASSTIAAVVAGVVFSFYALSGENEGFACLWILMVPVFGPSLLGMRVSFVLSLYFQVFLMALFYTPLNQIVGDSYTATFLARFPVLYFATFGGVASLAVQKQYYLNKAVRQAYHDGLTDLYNRAYYVQALEKHAENDFSLAVFDLNRLKYVNDTFGHLAGDEMICAAADLLRDAFEPDGMVARIGGDEFAVISSADAERLSDQLARFAESTCGWKGSFSEEACLLTLSAGWVARGEFPEYDLEKVLREADQRMYRDKADWYKNSGFERR